MVSLLILQLFNIVCKLKLSNLFLLVKKSNWKLRGNIL